MIMKVMLAWLLLVAPAWASTVQTIYGSGNVAPSVSAVNYQGINGAGNAAWNANETLMHSPAPAGAVWSNLRIVCDTDPNNGAGTQSYTLAVMDNGAATGLTTSCSDGVLSNQDTTHSITLVAGHTYSMRSTPANTPTSSVVRWSIKSVATNDRESIYFTVSNNANTSIRYHAPLGRSSNATETNPPGIVAAAGIFNNLYVECATPPGAGKTITLTARVAAAGTGSFSSQAKTCSITGAVATTCNDIDASHRFALSAGDNLDIMEDNSGGGASNKCRTGWSFLANEEGTSLAMSSTSSTQLSTTATEYVFGSAGNSGVGTTEALQNTIAQPCTLETFFVELLTAPGASANRTFNFKKAGSGTNPQVVISNTAVTGSDTTANDVAYAADNAMTIESVPSAGTAPAASTARFGAACFVDPDLGDSVMDSE